MMMVFPTRTHVYSMAPVGWALRAAGHEVRYVGQRNPVEVEPFLETGMDAMWFGQDLDIARRRRLAVGDENPMDSPYKLSESRPEKFTDDYIRTVYTMWAEGFRWAAPDSLLDELLRFARQWQPDLVVWDPMMYAGALVAHVIGAAHVRMLYAADQSARITFQYQEMRRRLGSAADRVAGQAAGRATGPAAGQAAGQAQADHSDPMVSWMADWLGRHGCEFDERLRFGMATIDPSPACIRYDLPVNYIPVRFVPVNRPMPIPRWILEKPRRPRVCLTLGVSNRQVHGHEEVSVGDLFEGLADLDVEVVATLNAAQLAAAGTVPDNVRAVDFIPMNELLPSCSAIIHQGGGATIGNAVVNAVPQLIVPGTTWSERASALALQRRGNGLLLDLDQVDPGSVRSRVLRLLDEPSFQRCADEVRREMLDTRTLHDIVPDLEGLGPAEK
jgi:L-2-deoxyfucosyltransferase/glycosyltransferase DesVII